MATKPVILCVDDEPEVLATINRDLRSRYRADYRVMRASSGAEALASLREMKARATPVALLLSDQRMPNMEGTEYLSQAKALFPDARTVLLTAYADTSAAIDSINSIGLDHYLMKPWDPPEQTLYPILDDLLTEWSASIDIPYDGIRVLGTLWSSHSHDTKDFLARNLVPYRWYDLERDADMQALAEETLDDPNRLPLVLFPDGEALVQPDHGALATKLGLRTEASKPHYDLIVIGGGPAGLAAGVYGASEGLSTLVIEREATGGQAGTSSRIENYLGFPKGLSGADLTRRATAQVQRLGAELMLTKAVDSVRLEDQMKVLTLSDGSELTAKSMMLCTGVAVRELRVPGIEPITGAGVYYGAALTEAANYRGQHVFVVGAANSAGQGAMFFSRYASQVTMLVRGEGLEKSMSAYLIEQIANTPNIDVRVHTEVQSMQGEDRLEALTLVNNQTKDTETVDAAAVYIFIGSAPRTELVADLVARDDHGFILTGPDLEPEHYAKPGLAGFVPSMLETSVPGIFAAGDVRHGSSKRVAAAVGEGSIAVRFVHQYLATI